MKKLFFLTLFMTGMFVAVQAQSCAITLIHNSSSNVAYSVQYMDGNGNQGIITANPSSSSTVVIQNFAFNLGWKGFNVNDCNTGSVSISGVSSGTEILPCTVPNSVNWVFSQPGGGLVDYTLVITVN